MKMDWRTFANPNLYEFLEAERIKYAIQLPTKRILQEGIHIRPVGLDCRWRRLAGGDW
jgi:hypothetical protein